MIHIAARVAVAGTRCASEETCLTINRRANATVAFRNIGQFTRAAISFPSEHIYLSATDLLLLSKVFVLVEKKQHLGTILPTLQVERFAL